MSGVGCENRNCSHISLTAHHQMRAVAYWHFLSVARRSRSCTRRGLSFLLSDTRQKTRLGRCTPLKCSSGGVHLCIISTSGQSRQQRITYGLRGICRRRRQPWTAFQPFHASEDRTESSPQRRLSCQTWMLLHQQNPSCTLRYRPSMLVSFAIRNEYSLKGSTGRFPPAATLQTLKQKNK
jgi:hypothetical protein